ncbi:MAG: DUF692 domain-containing protein [Myxococcales bacterium]|nr:DUF692 domain-containing protein [Myxococcales bacterium]MCB9549014.1 DUF692 domain-containing protein [Myxococcales bacterium]
MSGVASLGHGVGLRRPHWDTIFAEADRVDFVEILTENFLGEGGRARRVLEQAAATWPIVLHGTALSIGSVSPLDADYLAGLADLIRATGARWFSDHLCFSSAFGVEYHDLLPVPFTAEALDHVVARVKQVQTIANVPFLLENPSYYVQYAGAEMGEAEFLSTLCARADCGLLLDVNNVYVNSRNHGYDPYAFIDALPLDRVLQIHMAGHDDLGDVIIDTHGAACVDPVLDLYAYTLGRTGPVSTLLEWDNAIPSQAVLLAELERIRAVRPVGARP